MCKFSCKIFRAFPPHFPPRKQLPNCCIESLLQPFKSSALRSKNEAPHLGCFIFWSECNYRISENTDISIVYWQHILNCARNNINFCNYIPQTIVTQHIFKSIVNRIAYFFCLRSICLINRYFIIGSIADNSVSDVVPNKLNFCSPVQTALEFADLVACWGLAAIFRHRRCRRLSVPRRSGMALAKWRGSAK